MWDFIALLFVFIKQYFNEDSEEANGVKFG